MTNHYRKPKTESIEAIQAYNVYLSLGDTRSITAVAEKTGKNASLLKRWSATWHWPERVREHQRLVVAETQKAFIQEEAGEILERREQRRKVAAILRNKAMRYFENKELENSLGPDGKIRKAVDVNRASLALKMLEQADRAERLDYGEATERTQSIPAGWESLMMDNPEEEMESAVG